MRSALSYSLLIEAHLQTIVDLLLVSLGTAVFYIDAKSVNI